MWAKRVCSVCVKVLVYHSLASSSSCVTSDGGVKYPANLNPLSRKPILPNFVLKLARALSTGTHKIPFYKLVLV